MKFSKYLFLGGVALALGATSCVGDLDLEPNDPNYASPSSSDFVQNSFAECYSVMAVSGQTGPGSSIISGLDNGAGQYTRALFMMNEFPTDECIWVWQDAGVYDLVTNTWDSSNANCFGTYSRLFAHIAVCNQFLMQNLNSDDPAVQLMCQEVRALRAMSYYWVMDIFGYSSFVLESDGVGSTPKQISRPEIYAWLVGELSDLVDNKRLAEKPAYGRVGLDGAEALLARIYLNAEVYAGTPAYDKCKTRCENIIRRHQGGGFKGAGLANHYMYLFCRDNYVYMPGGGNDAENEILWGLAYDSDKVRTYGGTTFLIAAATTNDAAMSGMSLGQSSTWACMHAPLEFSQKFTEQPQDVRWSMWVKGKHGEGENEVDYTISNDEFSNWTSGYAVVKFTGLNITSDGGFSDKVQATEFSGSDLPLIRLADVYLMAAECDLRTSGVTSQALTYVNTIRERAGLPEWTAVDLNLNSLLDERCRELYWELTRRSDLVRFGKFAGPGQAVWAWKGAVLEGNNIAARYNVMPVPQQVIATQPDFKQNPGY